MLAVLLVGSSARAEPEVAELEGPSRRVEVSADMRMAVNGVRHGVGASGRAAYVFSDHAAVGARVTWFNESVARDVRGGRLLSNPELAASVELELTPVDLCCFELFGSQLHLTAGVFAGGGIVSTQAGLGSLKPVAEAGVRLTFDVHRYAALNLTLVDTAYVEAPVGFTLSSIWNLVAVSLGFGLRSPGF
jgi:hypothetical protein